ncbi:hypothetical protein LINPERPRIM_LOCUS5569 [Linum perenne]
MVSKGFSADSTTMSLLMEFLPKTSWIIHFFKSF